MLTSVPQSLKWNYFYNIINPLKTLQPAHAIHTNGDAYGTFIMSHKI